MKKRRLVLWLGSVVAAIIVILVLSSLLLPWLIDSQLIKEKIESILAEKTQGTVTLGKIGLLWFPRPTVTIDDTSIFFDEKTQGKVRIAKVYPSIIHLLMGRVVVRRAQLQEAQVKVHLPAPAKQPLDVDELERSLRSALTYFTTELSGLHITLSAGSAVIETGDRPPVILNNLDADAVASSEKLRFELSARSNLFHGFRVEGEIAQASLATRLAAKVEKLRLKETRVTLAQDLPEYLEDGELNFDLEIEALGLKKIKADINGALGSLALARRGRKANVSAKKLKANVVYDRGAIQTSVEQLELAQPRLKASGEFKIQPKGSSARIQVRDLDIAEIRGPALQIADDLPGVKTLFEVVKAGTIPEIIFYSGGNSLAEMGMGRNIVINGVMRNGRVFIPGPRLGLTSVNGSLRIAAGILEGRDLAAKLGTARGWDGKLRIGLEGKGAPFHLDVAVRTGASELHSVLLKLDIDDRLRRELLKVRKATGDLSGRLILGERLDALAPVISVSKIEMIAAYDPIPFPIVIKGGGFNYDQGMFRLKSMQASVGQSTLVGLSAIFHNDQSQRMKIESGRFSLDLEQVHILLRGFQDLRSHLAKLHSARGKLELADLTLEGVVSDPANWKFTSAGTVRQVAIGHDDFPGPVTLSRGKFTATQAKIMFSETALGMLDGSLTVGGVVERTKEFPLKVEARGNGIMGGKITQWLSRQAELPKELLIRSPLKIAAGHFDWRGAGNVSFRGRVTVAGGPQIAVDAAAEPQRVVVRELTIEDESRFAHFKANLLKDSLDLSFKGVLTQQTLDKIFASFPFQGSLLEGDIDVVAVLKEPFRFSARGHLQGSNLLIVRREEKARVEKFRIEGAGTSLEIRSAILRWRNSRLAVSGKVAGAKEALRLDMNVAADRLDWAELNRFVVSEGEPQNDQGDGIASFRGVEGKIRLEADSFTFKGYKISPLQMAAALSPAGIKADIAQAVACGIKAAGRIDVAGREIGLDIRLATVEGQLGPTSVCLTDSGIDVSGTYSMAARITGRGDRENLLPSLKGNFEINARDGEFVRSSAADATFDYLNATGDFKVAFPDLDKETFPYRLIRIKGRIDGDHVVNDEVIVQGTTLTITGQSDLDLRRRQIDAKGLISVSMPANQLIKNIPLIGPLVGGRLIGIPLRVTGSLDRPDVQYLSPADVGMELLNMPRRILGAPLEAIRIFTPSGDAEDKGIAK